MDSSLEIFSLRCFRDIYGILKNFVMYTRVEFRGMLLAGDGISRVIKSLGNYFIFMKRV